ncbi:MAG: DUF177 domain-containing protein [Deltaproteobacteria bacterium]|nr:MAG: DUF177 domain-containing protein [Deltaproteobacteria bacterium]
MKPELSFRLRDLPETRDVALEEAFVREALAAVPGQDQLDEPPAGAAPDRVHLHVEVTVEHRTAFAVGRLTGTIAVACSRCLGRVTLAVDEPFSLTFLPRSEFDAEPDDGDVELDADDLDVSAHDGETVDLAAAIRDHLVLSVPYAPLCADDCKGLCAQCGADLNAGACACPPAAADSPWAAALSKLKLE